MSSSRRSPSSTRTSRRNRKACKQAARRRLPPPRRALAPLSRPSHPVHPTSTRERSGVAAIEDDLGSTAPQHELLPLLPPPRRPVLLWVRRTATRRPAVAAAANRGGGAGLRPTLTGGEKGPRPTHSGSEKGPHALWCATCARPEGGECARPRGGEKGLCPMVRDLRPTHARRLGLRPTQMEAARNHVWPAARPRRKRRRMGGARGAESRAPVIASRARAMRAPVALEAQASGLPSPALLGSQWLHGAGLHAWPIRETQSRVCKEVCVDS